MTDHTLAPTTGEVHEDLGELRKQHEEISKTMTRVAILSLSAYLLLDISFSHAVSKIDGAFVRGIGDQLKVLSGTSQRDPTIPLFLRLFQGTMKSETPPSTPPTVERQLSKEAASDEQLRLENQLNEKEQEWFAAKTTVLGSVLELDLRYLILAAPFLVLGSGSFFFLLHKKRRLLLRLGKHELERIDPGAVPLIDSLYFRSANRAATPYIRYPTHMETLTYATALLALTIKLIVDLSPMAGLLNDVNGSAPDWWAWFLFWSAVSLALAYAVGYSCLFGLLMERQVDALLGTCQPELGSRLWAFLRRRLRALVGPLRVRPRISLTAGSLLVLISLPLMTAVSCKGKPRSGLALLVNSNDAGWVTTEGFLAPNYLPTGFTGHLLYAASITAAMGSLFLVALSLWQPPLLRSRKLVKAGMAIAGSTTLFIVASLGLYTKSLVTLGEVPAGEVPTFLCWLITDILWIKYLFSRQPGASTSWQGRRPYLFVLYGPLVVRSIVVLVLLATLFGLSGLAAFCSGSCLMAAAYLELCERLPPPTIVTARRRQFRLRRLLNVGASPEPVPQVIELRSAADVASGTIGLPAAARGPR